MQNCLGDTPVNIVEHVIQRFSCHLLFRGSPFNLGSRSDNLDSILPFSSGCSARFCLIYMI